MNRHSLQNLIVMVAMSAALVAMISSASADERVIATQAGQVVGDELTPQTQQAIARGLAWLASHQLADGSFGVDHGYGDVPATTALAGLAFMSAGHLPGRGQYGSVVAAAVDYFCNIAQESGLLAPQLARGAMYAHGYATLFLSQVYGMTADPRVGEKLHKAVALIIQSQNSEGGWRYTPVPLDADISVTICQVMALRGAIDAGLHVDPQVMQRALAYVRRCQNADGGFRYIANNAGVSAFERSAAGAATLYYAGVFQGDDLTHALQYVSQFQPGRMKTEKFPHYYYGHYYAVQAMFLAGGNWWSNWYPPVRDELINTRQDQKTGAFVGEISQEYSTACALIVLQMPNRYLPVFNGKGPGG